MKRDGQRHKGKMNRLFSVYRWQWWVILINFEGNLDDGRPETLRALLLLAKVPVRCNG